MKKRFLLMIFLMVMINGLVAQEILVPIEKSHPIQSYLKKNPQNLVSKSAALDTLELPFFDDFSYEGVYPNADHWVDKLVFINNSFAVEAPSKGVATFDGFNDKGRPYVESGTAFGVCDTLTSKPLNLLFPASDSIYLSFYVQPQGLGREPAINDSLILEFKNMNTGRFVTVKRWAGSKVKPFLLVMVPITQAEFLQKGFQFRFKNKGSQYGGDDHWHIDYVRLDRFRSHTEIQGTLDVSFNSNPTSLLTSYTAVPYNQFHQSMVAANHFVGIKNNFYDASITNVTFTFSSYLDEPRTFLDSVTKGLPMAPNSTRIEESQQFNIPVQTKPFDVTTTYTLLTANDFINHNDTIRSKQHFGDYFSYDDGTAENGYGITANADGRFAYLFNARNSDTLRKVRFFFTQKQIPISNELFTLTVWKSLAPEQIIYQKTSLSPSYIDEINGFVTYDLDSGVVLKGDFYVGWIQATNYFMNIGLDRNTINNDRMFYKVTSVGWQASTIQGSAMIRPVFSDGSPSVGITKQPKKESLFEVYPNPGNGNIHLKYNDGNNRNAFTVKVSDLQGRLLLTQNANEPLSILTLNKGIYIIQIYDENSYLMGTKKYIKNE